MRLRVFSMGREVAEAVVPANRNCYACFDFERGNITECPVCLIMHGKRLPVADRPPCPDPLTPTGRE